MKVASIIILYLFLISYNTPVIINKTKIKVNKNERFSFISYHVIEQKISFLIYNYDIPIYIASKYEEVFLFNDSAILQPNPGLYDTYHYDVPEMKIFKANSVDTGSMNWAAGLPVKYNYFIRGYTMDFIQYAKENKLSPESLYDFIEFEKKHSVLIPGNLWIDK